MADKTPTDVKVAETAAKAAQHLYDNKDKPFSWKALWEDTKDKAMRFFAALIMERDKKDRWTISIGRVSWWLAFLPALYIFIAAFQSTANVTEAAEMVSRDITPNHLTILLTLAGYNFGKKLSETAQNIWGKTKDGPG